MYKAKNVDTDKALEAINCARKSYSDQVNLEIAKKQAYLMGVTEGLNYAENLFLCSNFEKTKERCDKALEKVKGDSNG